MQKAKPFVKWAGGKGQLLKQLNNFFPKELREKKIKKYCEPFLGGGAVFFEVMQNYNIESAYLSDINKDLVLTYLVIQQKPEQLLDFLEQYQKEYDKTILSERNSLFLEIREHFNKQRFEINYKTYSDNWIPRAAQLIFINKTCFNGLYRMNSKGEFNVPFGKYKRASIIDEKNIILVNKILQKAEISIAPYFDCANKIDEKTFVYFDPPYRPLSKTSNFTTYSGNEFGDKEQIELASFFKKLDNEKVKMMLSNSDPKNQNPNDNFFEEIFSNYNIYRVSATRQINSNSDKRGAIKEIIVTNYDYEPQSMEFDF